METEAVQREGRLADVRYRHVLLVTTVLVSLTMLLGVATRAAGAGLACNANWPLCDGGLLNLFPASLPSAFEWIHRVVAMVTGFVILGATVGAWRGHGDDRVRWAVTLGLLLLPIQVLLGRETVVTFTPEVLAAHFWAAMAIYAAFAVATVSTWSDDLRRRHAVAGVAAALVLIPGQAVLAPPIVSRYTPPVQAAQYAIVLALFASLLVATVASKGASRNVRLGLAGATALVPVVVLLGRQRIVHDVPALGTAHTAATVLLFAVTLVCVGLLLRRGRAT